MVVIVRMFRNRCERWCNGRRCYCNGGTRYCINHMNIIKITCVVAVVVHVVMVTGVVPVSVDVVEIFLGV